MASKWVRAAAPLVMALALILTLVPVAVPAAPAAPDDPSAFTTEYDPRGPDGQAGLWVWDPSETLFRGPVAWQFVPVADWLVAASGDTPPAWPADVLTVQVVAVMTPQEEFIGFWIWNPYRFVGGDGAPRVWSPTWEWHVPPD